MIAWNCKRLLFGIAFVTLLSFNTVVYASPESNLIETDLLEIDVDLKGLQEQEFINKAREMNAPVYSQSSVEAKVLVNTLGHVSSNLESQLNTEYYDLYKRHCEKVTAENATLSGLNETYNQVGYLWKTNKIDMFTFKQILCMLEYTYEQVGVYSDKNEYLRLYQNELYQHSWDEGVYDEYMASILGYGNLGNPYSYTTTPSGDMVLATAYAVADSWTKGTSGEQLRYSQSQWSVYDSVISDKVFKVRPDCTGFCYTVLKELGCTIVDSELLCEGFYSGSMVEMCKNGEFESDPTIKVLPFDVNLLQPGDIMVASKTERLTQWGTTEPYNRREGHAEIFVGFPDENDKSLIDVWNWGSRDTVNTNFPQDAETFTPQRKHHPYNYNYIIRYVGGTRH